MKKPGSYYLEQSPIRQYTSSNSSSSSSSSSMLLALFTQNCYCKGLYRKQMQAICQCWPSPFLLYRLLNQKDGVPAPMLLLPPLAFADLGQTKRRYSLNVIVSRFVRGLLHNNIIEDYGYFCFYRKLASVRTDPLCVIW